MSPGEEDRESREVSVTLSKEYIEEQLLPQYPAATRASQAVRMAVQNDVKRQQQALTPTAIKTSIIEALQETGGGIESTERVVIKNAEDIDIEEAEDVDIAEVPDE